VESNVRNRFGFRPLASSFRRCELRPLRTSNVSHLDNTWMAAHVAVHCCARVSLAFSHLAQFQHYSRISCGAITPPPNALTSPLQVPGMLSISFVRPTFVAVNQQCSVCKTESLFWKCKSCLSVCLSVYLIFSTFVPCGSVVASKTTEIESHEFEPRRK
ncbi:unnamed protein product, partial [Laminaria digitata]